MATDLSVGIVGIRSVGGTHARALLQVEGARVTAFSGGDAGSGRALGWPGARRMSHRDLVENGDVDVVVLCSPSQYHGAAAIAVAQSGRHVVVEKPMALTVSEADRLVALQGTGPGIVAMVSQRRFETEYQVVKRLLDDGDLGTSGWSTPRFRGSGRRSTSPRRRGDPAPPAGAVRWPTRAPTASTCSSGSAARCTR